MPRKKERKKTLTDLEAIVSKGRLVLGQVFVYYRTVNQNRLMSPRNNKEQLGKVKVFAFRHFSAYYEWFTRLVSPSILKIKSTGKRGGNRRGGRMVSSQLIRVSCSYKRVPHGSSVLPNVISGSLARYGAFTKVSG